MMTMEWIPSGHFCPRCGGPNPAEIPCGSCDYKPGDSLWPKKESLTKEQFRERVAIQIRLGYKIKKRLKKFL